MTGINAGSVALAFMRRWAGGIDALRSTIDDYFTDATIWENVGLNRLTGGAQALAFINDYHRAHALDAIRVDLVSLLANDRQVMTERVDHLLKVDGTVIHSVRIMGVFEVEDGKILAQRDYFNPSPTAR